MARKKVIQMTDTVEAVEAVDTVAPVKTRKPRKESGPRVAKPIHFLYKIVDGALVVVATTKDEAVFAKLALAAIEAGDPIKHTVLTVQ